MTNDLSQCGNCIYHYTYNGNDMCKQVGDDFYLQWKVEDCPYHTTITSAIKISDEIYRLRAENAALRERLENAVELKAKVGDTIYLPWIYDGNFDIASLLIAGIYFKNDEFHYITNLKSDSAIYLAKYEYGIFRNQDFDNIVFTDRIAAEARLAELKGE